MGSPRRQRVLVVEDEAAMREFYLGFFERLHAAEFSARVVPDGERALGVLRHEPVDIVLLDWALPGISGASLAKALRADAKTRSLGILVVTAKTSAADTVLALEAGADDHLAKPFDEQILLARLRSLARRRELSFERRREERFPGLKLDADAGRLSLDGHRVSLTPKELDLLKIFLQRPNILHSHSYLWEALWGYESDNWDHILITTLSSLRKKLGPKWGPRLKFSRGRGYLFES